MKTYTLTMIQKMIIGISLPAILLFCVYVPWHCVYKVDHQIIDQPLGWNFIFDPPEHSYCGVYIDWEREFLTLAFVAGVSAALLYFARTRSILHITLMAFISWSMKTAFDLLVVFGLRRDPNDSKTSENKL